MKQGVNGMKKYLALIFALLLCLCAQVLAEEPAEGIPLDADHFPNEAFRNIAGGYDTNGDMMLSPDEIAAVTDMSFSYNEELTDAAGIEYFTALQSLNCSMNRLTSLDLRRNTALATLDCSANGLQTLLLGDNPALTSLICRYNLLTELDLSGCGQLAPALLEGFFTRSGDTLIGWNTGERKILQADMGIDLLLDQNPVKVELADQFPDPVFRQYVQNRLDSSGDGALRQWEINNAVSIQINEDSWEAPYKGIASLAGLEVFTELEELRVKYTALTSVDLSANVKLKGAVFMSNTGLTSVRLGTLPQLQVFVSQQNKLSKLDLSGCAGIRELIDGGIKMGLAQDKWVQVTDLNDVLILDYNKSTDVLQETGEARIAVKASAFPDAAFRSYVSGYLDLSGDGKLNQLEIRAARRIVPAGTQGIGTISSMAGLEYFPYLETLNCSNSRLTALNVSKNTKLESLTCSGNRIAVLDISKCPSLVSLVTKTARRENDAYGCSWYEDSGKGLFLELDNFVKIKAGKKTIPGTGEPAIAGEYADATGVYNVSENKTAVFLRPADAKAASLSIPAVITVVGVKVKVTAVDAYACKGMKKLTALTIGKNVKTIGAEAFSTCPKLKTVKGGANVAQIGDSAFFKCGALEEFTLQSKVEYIGAKAFGQCKKLKLLTVKTKKLKDASVGAGAFKSTGIKTVKCPKGKAEAYRILLVKKGVSKKAKFQ